MRRGAGGTSVYSENGTVPAIDMRHSAVIYQQESKTARLAIPVEPPDALNFIFHVVGTDDIATGPWHVANNIKAIRKNY